MRISNTYLFIFFSITSIPILSCAGNTNTAEDRGSVTNAGQEPQSLVSEIPDQPEVPKHTQVASFSFASSDKHYKKSETPFPKLELKENITGWKGERTSCQILIWPKANIRGLSLKISDLTSSGNGKIAASAVSYGFARYVAADISGGNCGTVKKGLPKIEIADAIAPQGATNITSRSVQPVWLTIAIPTSAKAGQYTGKISFSSSDNAVFDTLALTINVKDRTLPPPSQWGFHLDLWQYPLRVAQYYKVKPWTAEHFNKLKPTMQQLAQAGQKAITASFFWDVFSMENMGWGEENLMVRLQQLPDRTATYDFSNFDKWVEFMHGLGIKDQINCFGIYPTNSNYEFYYKDFQEKKTRKKTLSLLSAEYADFWTGMLQAFSKHLRSKGWMDKTVLYIDERPAKETMEVIRMVKKVDPAFKIGYTGAYSAQIEPDLYDFSIASYLEIPDAVLNRRNSSNKVTTFYTCCYEAKPNTFTYSSPAEGMFMGLYAAANNYDGYVRWAYDLWERNILEDTRASYIPAGDGILSYPERYRCVRFEKLAEGIQCYEKINILKKELSKKNNQEGLRKLNNVLNKCKRGKVNSISNYAQLIGEAKDLLNSF